MRSTVIAGRLKAEPATQGQTTILPKPSVGPRWPPKPPPLLPHPAGDPDNVQERFKYLLNGPEPKDDPGEPGA